MASVGGENVDNTASRTARSGVADENDARVELQDAFKLDQCSSSLPRLCNIHNLASPICHISYPKQCITFIYSTSSSWNICLVPQYSRHLGLRLVPYSWTCQPVRISILFRLLQVVPLLPNRTCPTFDQHRGDPSVEEGPLTAETRQNKFSFDSHTSPKESPDSPAASVINDEESELADKAWVPNTKENLKIFNSPPHQGVHEGDVHIVVNESHSWKKIPAMASVDDDANLLLSGVTNSGAGQHNGIISDARKETDENRTPNNVRKQFADIVVDVDNKRKSESVADGCLVDKSLVEPDTPKLESYELTINETLFLSPIASLHCNLKHSISKDESCVENLTDLLGTSTSLEDHVNDFTDLLGREFDEMFATYSDLCTMSPQRAVGVGLGSSDVVNTEKESCKENCSV